MFPGSAQGQCPGSISAMSCQAGRTEIGVVGRPTLKASIGNQEQVITDDTNYRKRRDRSWHRELPSRSTKAIVLWV